MASVDVAIIADDLTGAADSGVQLVRSGYRTAVVFHGTSLLPTENLDSVAVTTYSRDTIQEACVTRSPRGPRPPVPSPAISASQGKAGQPFSYFADQPSG
jgi:Sugar-binding N-terminal domain